MRRSCALAAGLLLPAPPLLASQAAAEVHAASARLDLTASWAGIGALMIFCVGYLLVILEEQLHMRKSKPMLLAAGLIWIIIALVYNSHDLPTRSRSPSGTTFSNSPSCFSFCWSP